MKNNKKGFTLAEMLIVVAIIGVLIAILVPTFSSQLNKAKVAASQANIRSAVAEATVLYLENDDEGKKTVTTSVDLTASQVNEIGGVSYSGDADLEAGNVTVVVNDDGVTVRKAESGEVSD